MSDRNNHILIIPSWYPYGDDDINGSFFREQAIALRKRGYKVGVIVPMVRSLRDIKGLFQKPYGIKYDQDNGVNTYRGYYLNITPRMPEFSKKRWINIGKSLFEDYVNKHGLPDVIHVHSMIYAGYLAFEISYKYKIPYVITEHSTSFARNLIPSDVISSLQKVVSSSEYNIAVSKEFKYLLNKIFKTNSWNYIPNIVNDIFFKDKLRSNINDFFVFINVCILDSKKRLDILIIAFSKVFKGNRLVKLKIGGDGSSRFELEELVKELGISSQIEFLGLLSRDEVVNEMSKANAFVLSSEYETFGVVLVEALALGKPVIATKCGGPESIVSSEVGYLIEKNSVDEMSKTMLNLVNNYNKFSAENIRQYCINNFSEKAVIDKLEKIYSNIINLNHIHEK